MFILYGMCWLFSLFLVALFYVLTPGVLISIPQKGSLKTKALVHGVVFGVVFYITYKLIWEKMYRK